MHVCVYIHVCTHRYVCIRIYSNRQMDREAPIQNRVYLAKDNKTTYVDLAFTSRASIWEEERL